MAQQFTKYLLVGVSVLLIFFILVASGMLPYPLSEEMEHGIGIDAPSFVWGASTGFTDYVATYTFQGSAKWVNETTVALGFTGPNGMSQQECLGQVSIPWWIALRDDANGKCWSKENYSEFARKLLLFFDESESRVTVFVYEE